MSVSVPSPSTRGVRASRGRSRLAASAAGLRARRLRTIAGNRSVYPVAILDSPLINTSGKQLIGTRGGVPFQPRGSAPLQKGGDRPHAYAVPKAHPWHTSGRG